MRVLAAITGSLALALVLVDAFNTLVLSRRTRHPFRIALAYYGATWRPFVSIARRIESSLKRESFLGVYGPLSLLLLFALWAFTLIVAFGLLRWSAGSRGTLSNDMYLSANTLFTLTNGDPDNFASKFVATIEGGLGLGFLGLTIGYLPVLYQSFSQRELQISLLDARGGSPPSAGGLLEFSAVDSGQLERQFADWEEWCAQLLETNLSFTMLAYFRSQHSNQSWLTALVAMVDCAAVVRVCATGSLRRQAELTFAMGRHALADLTVVFKLEEQLKAVNRLPESEFAIIRKIVAGRPELFKLELCSAAALEKQRRMYEPQAAALSKHFLMALPEWIATEDSRDNWRVGMEDREEVPFAVSDPFANDSEKE